MLGDCYTAAIVEHLSKKELLLSQKDVNIQKSSSNFNLLTKNNNINVW